MDIKNIKAPQFANAENTVVNCQIEHPIYGWIPFTASPDDSEQHGRDLFAALIAGDHGPIAAYSPPQPLPFEQLAANARLKRNMLLAECDWTQLLDAQASLTDAKKSAWLTYRLALRNLSDQHGFPDAISWPVKP